MLGLFLFFYNLFFPIGLIFFLPSLITKFKKRGGAKKNFSERFGIFSKDKEIALGKFRGALWIHSVSVGETQIAVSFIKKWQSFYPDQKFVISTTTTTGQAIAEEKLPPNTIAIFCPIDYVFIVRRTFNLIAPSALIIFETELWPNMICESRRRGIPVSLVNARVSDRSFNSYLRFSFFFSPLMKKLSLICAQTEQDKERLKKISPLANVVVSGNMKFDQSIPQNMPEANLSQYFGETPFFTLMGASTHPGEEKVLADAFISIKKDYSNLKLLLVPRHAERAPEISAELERLGIKYVRKTKFETSKEIYDCLLLDTTGEMLAFMAKADIVVMGKSFAGHDEGHNLIEPALLSKPIITGAVLKNFRFVLDALRSQNALITINSDNELETAIRKLLENKEFRIQLGKKAFECISRHGGATEKTIKLIKELL